MLKVLGRKTSNNVQKVLWCLAELQRPFQQEDYGGPFGKTRTPEYLRLNPHGTVPTLIDGEVVERAMPDTTHAQLTVQMVLAFAPAITANSLWLGSDLRVKTSAGNSRLVDVIAYREKPAAVPENPPLVTVEIVSRVIFT